MGRLIGRVHRRERAHARPDVLQFAVLHDDDGAGERHHDVHFRDADDGPGPVQRLRRPDDAVHIGMASNNCTVINWIIMKMAIYMKLWRVKHENTAWHTALQEQDEFEVPGWEDLKGGSHDAFMMNQRITSETFRFKFLNYNRAWLINQLPSILTPRTLRRSRPYLINQFTRILNQLNQDISSDSEDDGRKFGPVALKANSRQIIRWWLAQARRRMRLREVVQPLISKARGTQCENCLSRRQLQVTCVIPLEVLAAQFDAENADQEFDQVAWKTFWIKSQRYRTICT